MMTSEWSFPRRGSEQYVLPSTKPRRRWGVVVLGVVSVVWSFLEGWVG